MNYLLNKKIKRKKIFKISICVVVFFVLIYFRMGIWNGLSYISYEVFRPILILGNNIGEKFKNTSSYFAFKNSLYLENQNLKSQISESQADRANYDSVVMENVNLKEILGRKNEKAVVVLATILSRPNQNIYDTLIIDAGIREGIKIGDKVFAKGNVPIGRIDLVYDNSSKVILYSNSLERTQAVVSHATVGQVGGDIFLELIGRGGGNFEMILPRDFVLQKDDQVLMPGLNPYVLAIVETVISDPRDPFTKALLRSPVNVWELKFVEVEVTAK